MARRRRPLPPHFAHWAGALALAALVRIAYVWAVTRHDRVVGDQIYYSVQARANAFGHWFVQPFDEGRPGADHPPLTVLLLTPITFVFRHGAFVMAQRWFNVSIGIVNVGLLGYLVKRSAGERAAVVAMGLAAVQASWWMGDGLVLSEPASVLAILLLLLAVLHLTERPTTRRAVLGGALGGVVAFGRPEMALLVPFLVLPAAAVGLRDHATRRSALVRMGVALGAAVIVVTPWIGWNLARFEDRVLISSNDGFTLLGANCPTTYFGPGIGTYDIGCALAPVIPPGLDSSQASAIRSRIAVDYVRAHLTRLPLVGAARLGRLALVYGVGNEVTSGPAEGRPTWAMWIGVVQHWLLLPFAVLGAFRLDRRHRRLVLAVPAVSILAAVVIASYWRIRVPADIALVLLAATGIDSLLGSQITLARAKTARSLGSKWARG